MPKQNTMVGKVEMKPCPECQQYSIVATFGGNCLECMSTDEVWGCEDCGLSMEVGDGLPVHNCEHCGSSNIRPRKLKLWERASDAFQTSCGDERRIKGCYTARQFSDVPGRTFVDEDAMKERRCVCYSFQEARQLIAEVRAMEMELDKR